MNEMCKFCYEQLIATETLNENEKLKQEVKLLREKVKALEKGKEKNK